MCMRKIRRCGRPPTRSARRCRSSITCRMRLRTIRAPIAFPSPSPPLRRTRAELAARTSELVGRGGPLIPQIQDVRLGAEIAAIHALARRLACDLESRDPLSERVHLSKAGFALVGGLGAVRFLGSAMMRAGGGRAKAAA